MLLFLNIDFLEIRWIDLVDIFLVSLLLYQLYRLIKGSMAVRILIGGFSIFVVFWLVDALGMQLLSSILGQFVGVGVLAALIIFQQEIRKFLFIVGRADLFDEKSIFRGFFRGSRRQTGLPIDIFMDAVNQLSSTSTGALIVFSKGSNLKFYADTGDKIDAIASKRLINAIFYKNSPLHDGALIVDKNGRLVAARCILPVSENTELPASLGLRHRSAIGLTEVTDAVVLVVSEETRQMSLVKNGEIYRNLPLKELRRTLIDLLTMEEEEETEEEDKKDDNEDNNEPELIQVKT